MNEEQEVLLERYRDLWVKMNAALSAKADIETYIRELKERQRSNRGRNGVQARTASNTRGVG